MAGDFKSEAPCLLLATPHLLDPNFHETVVLLFQHTPKGALGLVVNRPSRFTLGTIAKNLDLPDGAEVPGAVRNSPIMKGGPVSPESGWVVFEGSDETGRSFKAGEGLVVTGSIEVFRDVLQSYREKERGLMFLLGYAGWGPGQLDDEMREGAWMTAPVDRSILFHTAFDARWKAGFKSIGIDPAFWSIVPGEG